MKKITLFVFAALLAATSYAAEQLPLFNALLTIGKEQRFVLVNSAGKTSEFLKLGAAFEGYTLKSYDAKTSTLEIEKDGKTAKITLVADAAVTSAPALAPTPATLADAEEVFRVMKFDEMMRKVMDAQKKAMAPVMAQGIARGVPPGVNLSPEDKAALSALQAKIVDQSLSAITSPEMRSAMARIYTEVFSKDELNSMAAFYSTPGGQALVDKQPAVQEKMMGVMMPMVMQSQQASQKEMREFMTGLRAKYSPSGTAPATPPAPTPNP